MSQQMPIQETPTTGGKTVPVTPKKPKITVKDLWNMIQEQHEEEIELLDEISGRLSNFEFMLKCLNEYINKD